VRTVAVDHTALAAVGDFTSPRVEPYISETAAKVPPVSSFRETGDDDAAHLFRLDEEPVVAVLRMNG
jgi:hypothetical protein